MELIEGKWSNQDLAKWFGILPSTLSKNKKKKLKELSYHAEFYEEKKKIVITKVLNPVYSKNINENYKKIENKIDGVWSKDGLDTCVRVGNKIYDLLVEEDPNFKLKKSTVINYTYKGRNELYGKPFFYSGRLGKCMYVWCKRDRNTGEYSLLTEEEEEIKKKIQLKYFGDANDKSLLIKDMVEAGEIKKEEAWEVFEEISNMKTGNFMLFLGELEAAFGCQIVRGTLVEREKRIDFE